MMPLPALFQDVSAITFISSLLRFGLMLATPSARYRYAADAFMLLLLTLI